MDIIEFGKANGKAWTPGSGQARYYLNDWHPLAGLWVRRYGTGNVAEATLDGEKISNGSAREIVDLKVWIGAEDGEVHAEDFLRRREASIEQRITAFILSA